MNTNISPCPPAVERKYLNSKGLVAFLQAYAGFTLSRSSLYQLTMDPPKIPHVKGPGGRLLFEIAVIKRWVDNGGKLESKVGFK